MNHAVYALDANIIIDFLNQEPFIKRQFDGAAKSGIQMVIPSVVDYEILRGFYHSSSPRKEAVYDSMRVYCPVIEINTDIWRCAASIWASLRKTGRTVGDADILIAAYCLVNGYKLVTHNTKDFAHIKGLELVNWIV